MTQSNFTRGYNSFSGVDIRAVFGNKAIGSLQGISYSITREKAPIYTMGSADPRAFARGKRGIAGSLVFIQFDGEPLMEELAPISDPTNALKFIADKDDLRPQYTNARDLDGQVFAAGSTDSTNEPGAPVQLQETLFAGDISSDQETAIPWYPDQIPPFDVVLSAANEYGALATMRILGVELMNNGYGVSIDDIVSEHSYTYIAHAMLPWTSLGRMDPSKQQPGGNTVTGGPVAPTTRTPAPKSG